MARNLLVVIEMNAVMISTGHDYSTSQPDSATKKAAVPASHSLEST